MLASVVALLPSIIPVILWVIGLFSKNDAIKQANQKAFLDAISAHHDDAVAAANERRNVWEQDREMREKFAKRDAEAAKVALGKAADGETPKKQP